jgi:pimeloyl-ACP methyl ester carboxylesterase
MNNKKIGFILISGGQMSDWIWKDFLSLLKYPFIIISSRLENNNLKNRINSNLSDCVDHVLKQLSNLDFNKYIIIGHSIGGILAAQAGAKLKDQVEHIIYIAANLPKNNNNAISSFPLFSRLMINGLIYSQVKKETTLIGKEAKYFLDLFCNTCPAEVKNYISQQNLKPEPLCLFKEKVRWGNFENIPQTYIRLLTDKTISPEIQRKVSKNTNIKNIIDIESDHMVMLSHPKELLSAIEHIL